MRANPLYQSFNAGELSPLLIARTAFPKYSSGLAICLNLIPLLEGGLTRRPGTRFVAEEKDSTKKIRLKKFEFSTIQAYMLEFGDQYIRFYRHQGQIQTSGVSAWVTATPYVIGDLVTNGGNTYYCITAHTSGATFAGDAAYWYQQSGTIYEIPTTYLEADLPNLSFVQSADVLYIFHNSYAPRKLTRTGHTSWTLTEIDWVDGPYFDTNTTATTLTPSGTTGSVTITASAITGINGGVGFKSTDVGRLIRISNPVSGTDYGYAKVTAFTDTTHVTATVKRNFSTTNASATWRLGAWSSTTGYPKAAGLHQQRMVAAGTTDQPQTIWFGQTGDFENMSPDSPNPTGGAWDGTIEDDDALDRTISSDEVNGIAWVASLRDLLIGTIGGEWIASSSGAIITPTDITLARHTKIGSAQMQSLVVGNRILFLQRAKRKIIELGFAFEDSSYRDADLTRLARHITYGGLSRIVYAQEPHKLILGIRADGVIAGMTYNRAEDVVGWFRWNTDGLFEDIDVIPGANGAGQVQDSTDRDEIWVSVKRTINSVTKRYIEVFERDHESNKLGTFTSGHAQEDAYYADCLATYDSTATTTITGLDHLEAKEVVLWADGAEQTPQTVASGNITLEAEASVVQVGLKYIHEAFTLKPDFGAQAGTAIGKPKRFHALTFILLNAHSMKYGNDDDTLLNIDFRQVSDVMDAAVPLFTGEWSVDFDGYTDTDARIYIESEAPAPFTLLGIAAEMKTNELL